MSRQLLRGSRLLTGCLFLLALNACSDDDSSTSPIEAQFSLSRVWAETGETIVLNAAATWDGTSPEDSLEVRWDLDGDGDFDTAWGSDSLQQVSWEEAQLVRITLEVRDCHEDEDSDWLELTVLPSSFQLQPELVSVSAGGFQMGLSSLEQASHWVDLNAAYALGRTEVSNGEYLCALNWAWQNLRDDSTWALSINPNNGSLRGRGVYLLDTGDDASEIWYSEEHDLFLLRASEYSTVDYAFPEGYNVWRHPVKGLSWYGAAAYCDWLSVMDGRQPLYGSNWNEEYEQNPYDYTGWRLPTEAEWEFAARQPDGRLFPWGDEDASCSYTNFRDGADICVGWSQPVGIYSSGASELGFLDMAGNVGEWVQDWADDYEGGTDTNPLGPDTGDERVIRGGGWSSYEVQVCSAYRKSDDPLESAWDLGFRVAYGNHP